MQQRWWMLPREMRGHSRQLQPNRAAGGATGQSTPRNAKKKRRLLKIAAGRGGPGSGELLQVRLCRGAGPGTPDLWH